MTYRGVQISLRKAGWYAGITKALLPSLPKSKEITRAVSSPEKKGAAFHSLVAAIDAALESKAA